jgi:hypothetical protein
MAQQTINLGSAPNDGTGDDLRAGGDKINDNFDELYAAAAAAVTTLDGLSDVNAPAPAAGDVLTWDATPGEWVPSAPSGGGSFVLDDATDVDTTGAADGDVLTFDSGSSEWVPAAPSGSGSSPSVQSVASSATVTPTFADDQVNITAQAAGLTLANPTGTAIPAWGIVIRIKDNGTARSIAYDTQYRAIGVTLPTTTVISKTLYLAMIYNSTDTKWDVVAVAQEG